MLAFTQCKCLRYIPKPAVTLKPSVSLVKDICMYVYVYGKYGNIMNNKKGRGWSGLKTSSPGGLVSLSATEEHCTVNLGVNSGNSKGCCQCQKENAIHQSVP